MELKATALALGDGLFLGPRTKECVCIPKMGMGHGLPDSATGVADAGDLCSLETGSNSLDVNADWTAAADSENSQFR